MRDASLLSMFHAGLGRFEKRERTKIGVDEVIDVCIAATLTTEMSSRPACVVQCAFWSPCCLVRVPPAGDDSAVQRPSAVAGGHSLAGVHLQYVSNHEISRVDGESPGLE